MILRMFDTAVAPQDVEKAKELFRTQVRPAFDAFEGCHGIEMFISLEEHSGDYADVAALSRWDDQTAIDNALQSQEYEQALSDLKMLFQQNPIVRHFETAD